VMIDLPPGITADRVATRCAERGVKISPWNASRVRAVTHLDVDAAGIDLALETIRAIVVRATT